MSSHAGKTTFFIKRTSRITPKLLPKSVQNTSKMEPKRVPKRSRRPSPKKVQKDTLKCSKGLPKMTPKRSPKSQKTVWVASFSHRKNYDFLEAVFSCFLSPPGGPRPSKSSQNAVRVCKNRGLPFLLKKHVFLQKCSKNDPLWDPQRLLKTEKPEKRDLRKEAEKKTKKTLKYKPVLAWEREARLKE